MSSDPSIPGPVTDSVVERAQATTPPLFCCKVAGIPYRQPDLSKVSVGDTVLLIHEPHNPFDPNAIKVMHNGVHLGYIPKDATLHVREWKMMRVMKVQPAVKWAEVLIEEVR